MRWLFAACFCQIVWFTCKVICLVSVRSMQLFVKLPVKLSVTYLSDLCNYLSIKICQYLLSWHNTISGAIAKAFNVWFLRTEKDEKMETEVKKSGFEREWGWGDINKKHQQLGKLVKSPGGINQLDQTSDSG